MNLREEETVAATVEAIWPWLADPSRWPEWNDKIKAVRRQRSGPLQVGESFEMTTELSQRRDMQVEVKAIEPPRRLVVRGRYEWRRRWRSAEESWELSAESHGSRTRIRHITDLRDTGIPLPVQWLIWFIQSHGRKVGPSMWLKLEELIRAQNRE
jgi:uncharacterized protein YndB with AHSA1/START domain